MWLKKNTCLAFARGAESTISRKADRLHLWNKHNSTFHCDVNANGKQPEFIRYVDSFNWMAVEGESMWVTLSKVHVVTIDDVQLIKTREERWRGIVHAYVLYEMHRNVWMKTVRWLYVISPQSILDYESKSKVSTKCKVMHFKACLKKKKIKELRENISLDPQVKVPKAWTV